MRRKVKKQKIEKNNEQDEIDKEAKIMNEIRNGRKDKRIRRGDNRKEQMRRGRKI